MCLTSLPSFSQIYPYLVLNDPQGSRCRSEERILQLLSMVNLFLEKDKVPVIDSALYMGEDVRHCEIQYILVGVYISGYRLILRLIFNKIVFGLQLNF